MSLKEKLKSVRDTVTESVEVFAETSELNAEEYAKYYGASYVNFLNYIKRQRFEQISEDYDKEKVEDNEDASLSIVLPIVSIKDKDIIFDDEEFGAREKFNMTILKNLLYKARISYEINEDLTAMTLTDDKTERISDRVEKLSENKDEYIAKAKEMVSAGNQFARSQAKRLLRSASEWADNNL